ncbi:MAG: dTMP kinase [Dehalococcoidales bacterium]|nr:dTMP kinase [Dehalococcoidales bacterium]
MSLFITFEGGEGCGKSYQTRILFNTLNKLAIPVVLTHEPGGTPVGDRITRLLKWAKKEDISGLTELLLFNASRSQLIDKLIKPALQDGKIVICDRFTDSTLAYQGYGRGISIDLIKQMNETAARGLKPDLTVLLDLPVGAGLQRKSKQKADRFHQENLVFHDNIRTGFLELAKKEPQRWLVIDASQSRTDISRQIWELVSKLIYK